jgi:tRNA (cmo5U34)-methyltransferase
MKATPEQIRERFDGDVERFSNLETGQSATMDAPLVLDLIAGAAAAVTPDARALLDIGCGAGNYSLRLLGVLPRLEEIALVDLSRPMLDRALQRIRAATTARLIPIQADIRRAGLGEGRFDVAVAAATLHHLRSDDEWRDVFDTVYRSLRPDGCFWISDLVQHSLPAVHTLFWERYGEYLISLKGAEYRDHVFEYIRFEDTPRPLPFQLDLLRSVGFRQVEVLHKNGPFAAFGAVK